MISIILYAISALLVLAGTFANDEDESKRTLLTLAIYAVLLSIRLAL